MNRFASVVAIQLTVAVAPSLGQTLLGTAFTYQGQLKEAGVPLSDTADFQFTLWDAVGSGNPPVGGTQVGGVQAINALPVNAGLFNVTLNASGVFGANAFIGNARWLQVAVRSPAGSGAFTTLAPRQPLTAVPNAQFAQNAARLGGVAAVQYLHIEDNGSGLTDLNADNIATGTLDNGRLGLIPTGNIADNAVTAPKIASGQVVKSLNTLKDNVTLAAGTNISITPAGNTLTIASTSGGVGGSGTTNSIPFWSSATALGSSQITQDANGVQLPNGVQLAVGAQGNGLSFGSPNGETGLTIAGSTGRADLRFGTFNSAETKLKLVVRGAGSGPPAETNGIAITTAGYVGIGTSSPASKLDISASGDGAEMLRFTTERPWVFRQAYSGPGTALRLQPVTGLKNFEITAAGGTNVATFVGDDANPRVGIGTTNPLTKLALNGGTSWTSAFWNGSLSLSNASAIGWEANDSGQRFGIGQSTGGLYFFRTYAAFGQTVPPPNYDLAIQDNGNLTQARANNGLVKAMAFVNADGTILRCYNGVTGASGNCGFSISRPFGNHYYDINFGFQVDDRFVSVTPQQAVTVNIGASFRYLSSTVVQVRTFIPDVDWSASGAANPFMIIVY